MSDLVLKSEGLVIFCSDPRIYRTVNLLTDEIFGPKASIDHIVLPGGATADTFFVVAKSVALYNLHHFKKVVVIAHSDCGALPNHTCEHHTQAAENFATALQREIPVEVMILYHHTNTFVFDKKKILPAPAG